MVSSDQQPIDISLQDLDSRLVFTRFGELAKRKNVLYSDFIEIDEFEEIGDTWVKFSGQVVEDLLSVIDLTKSLFDRLIDEVRRSQEEPNDDELNRIKNLTQFWLDLSIVSYLYATMEKRGVLDQPGTDKYSVGYVETKKSLDDLTKLAFQAGQEFFSLESRIILSEILELNMEKQRLDYLDQMSDVEEKKKKILGGYDKGQAEFLMSRVWSRFLSSSEMWWFMDPIGMHSASQHALSHIDSMKEHWSECTSDLIEKGNQFYKENSPIAKITSDVSLAHHYRKLAMEALATRSNEIAADYFSMAAELTSSLGLDMINQLDQLNLWEPSLPEQYLVYNQMHYLSTVSVKYQSIIKYLREGKPEKVKELISTILENLSNSLQEGDIAYVSSVAVAYETVFEYIAEQLDQNRDVKEIISFAENRISAVAERLHKASHQITKNWLKVLRNDKKNVSGLHDIVKNIQYPLMAIYILPPNTDQVEPASNELKTLELVTEALKIDKESDKLFGKNPVQEMLMRAKTFELCQEAMEKIESIKDEETHNSLSEVLKPVIQNAFLRGLIAEIQLRIAVLQFRYINRIASIIENSSLAGTGMSVSEIDDEELSSFINSLEELHIATTEVQKYQSPIKISGAPLNWNYITKLEYYSTGIKKVLGAVRHAMSAAGTKDPDDSIQNWDDAKNMTFEAAEEIAKSKTQDAENLSQQVYTLAQLFHDFENKARERMEIEEIPTDGVVELLSSLLMGL